MLLALAVLLVVIASPARAQLIDVPPFLALDGGYEVETYYGNATVAAAPDSSVLVVTSSWWRTTEHQEAIAQRFAAAGGAAGGQVRLDQTENVSQPRVESDSRGGYVAHWTQNVGSPLVARLLDGAGQPTTTPFTVVAIGVRHHVAAGLPTGVVIVWSETDAVRFRLYDPAGQPVGSPVLAAQFAPFGVFYIGVARVAGGFVVAWDEYDGPSRGRVFDASGTPLGPAFEISDEFDMQVVATNPLGGFAIVGSRPVDTHARHSGVWARRSDDVGQPIGLPILVDRVEPDLSVSPQAAFDPAGRLYVAWTVSSFTIGPRGRAFDPSGRPLHRSFALHDDLIGGLAVTARPDGRFVEAFRNSYDLMMQVRELCVPPFHTGCGDGVVESTCERCDAGPANSDVTPDACRTTCTFAACGDGVIDHGEDCDDGNLLGCDGCDAECNLEPGYVCGDGVLFEGCDEQCDDGAGNDDDLPNACRTDCQHAHCGDGVRDDGEGCDDGNRTSCDGCSDLCVPEPGLTCGDGISEVLCGEQCDDGNVIVGDGCAATCDLERIPGGGSPATDCVAEWVVDNPTNVPLLDKRGAFNGVQACRDGDARCDFDAVAGTCTFHVRVCADNTDLPACEPGSRLRSWELRAPSATKAASHPPLAAVRAAFASVPGAIVGPTLLDVCSDALAVPIALKANASGLKAGSVVLKGYATLYTGEKDSDKLKLICLP